MTSERKTETVEISTKQGKVAYAKVAARLAEYHRDNKHHGQIITDVKPLEMLDKEGGVALLFTATVQTIRGEFTGHSLCRLTKGQKETEKAETVAVGRALAFAGYLATGEIATAEEMADFEEQVTVSQLNALKLKYAKEHAEALKGKDRPAKAQAFNTWARDVVGEDVDFRDAKSWEPDWLKACWAELTGSTPDVPFEE